MQVIVVAIVFALLGVLLGLLSPVTIPIIYARYTAVALLAALDSIFGAFKAYISGTFESRVFFSGLLTNMTLAAGLTYFGDKLGVDLSIAAIVAFGVRIFNNLGAIRRHYLYPLRLAPNGGRPSKSGPRAPGSPYNPPQPARISQRSRRHPSTALSRRKKTVGLDLGTSRVAVVIGESDDPGAPVSVIGVGESPSDGLRKGVVVNLDKTIAAIQAASVAAERMAGQRIEAVVVSLAGAHLWSQNSTGVVAVASTDHEIGEEDVHRVVEASRAISVPSDRQVIHVIPRAYTVDGQDGVRDAVGMTGHRLEVETNIITGAQTAVQNVIKCVHGAGFDIEDVVCSGLAAGEGVLTPQEIDLGVCLIEIGAGTTAVVVYNDGSARHLAVLPVGGNHVTSDIAIGLRTTLDEAEKLKLNYGHTLPDVIDHGEKVEVRQVGGDRIQALPRRFLAEIIGPRMQEIFQMARAEVRKTGFDGLLPAGVVVTGGGSRLMGTTDAAQAVFDTSVRLGQPAGMVGLADHAQGPSFAVACGLVKWGSRAHARAYGNSRQAVSLGSTYQKTVRWLRDFF